MLFVHRLLLLSLLAQLILQTEGEAGESAGTDSSFQRARFHFLNRFRDPEFGGRLRRHLRTSAQQDSTIRPPAGASKQCGETANALRDPGNDACEWQPGVLREEQQKQDDYIFSRRWLRPAVRKTP